MTSVEGPSRIVPAAPTPAPEPIPSGQLRTLRMGQRALNAFAILLPPVLAAYAFFDRGFAYVHVPGTPIFAGEVVMLAGFATLLFGTSYVRRGFQRSTVAKVLLVFTAWGLLRTIPYIESNGIDAVRDAALWYYALIAIPVCAAILAVPDVLKRWTDTYTRFIPWLLIYSPIALFLDKAAGRGFGPLIPGTQISIFDHKGANVSVQVAIALAFLWLVPGAGGKYRVHLTAIATIVLLVGATQGRSGFVAAAFALALVAWFSHGRGRLAFAMAGTMLLIVVAAWGLNVQIEGEQGRSVSVEQLAANLGSVVGSNSADAPGYLDANVQFRDKLWSATLRKVRTDGKMATGLGFGLNIAKTVGFEGGDDVQLRSPHNSHLDVYARMGLIGIALWVALWSLLGAALVKARSKFRAVGRRFEAGLTEVCMVAVVAILVNAYFDPTLESPPVAVWLWTIVGIAFGLIAMARRAAPEPAPATGTALVIYR
jgi:O-antigen ligase